MCADGGCQNSTGNHRWLECDEIHQQPWWPATFSTKFHNFEGLGEIILHILKGWSLRTRGQLVENLRVPYNPLGQELILGLEEIEGFSPSTVWVGFKYIVNSWAASGPTRGPSRLCENVLGSAGWPIWFVYVPAINASSGVCGMLLVIHIALDALVPTNMATEYCWMVKLSCRSVRSLWSV